MDLKTQLPGILPLAIEWAENVSGFIQSTGISLDEDKQKIAVSVGVSSLEKVTILIADNMPQPEHPILKEASLQTGLTGPDTAGLTLGHSIFIKRDCVSDRLISHELRHVHQYESFQSISAFLTEYLRQIIDYGYYDAPLELDARQQELLV